MTQTKKRSLFEVICNTGSGVVTAYLTWRYIVQPWAGLTQCDLNHLSVVGIVVINSVFTIVSVVRGYLWRRFFNWLEYMRYCMTNKYWVIQVGGDYGSFLFEGTEQEAEQRRKDKARWEGAIALKRPADIEEVKTGETSYCWNHPNFKHAKKGIKYDCDCCS